MNHMPSPFTLLFFSMNILMVLNDLMQCEARDSLAGGNNILRDNNQTLVSAKKRFELGFFTPEGNERGNRYVGVWYHRLSPRTIVWIANRDVPIQVSNAHASFGIDLGGNLKIWSAEVPLFNITSFEKNETSRRILQLLDTGNLKLYDLDDPGRILWQSFDHPTDTFLPGMEMDDTGAIVLTAWINKTNPSTGTYTFRKEQGVYTVYQTSNIYWRSGELGMIFRISQSDTDMSPRVVRILSNDTVGSNQTNYIRPRRGMEMVFYNYKWISSYATDRLLMNSSGEIQYYHWNDMRKSWDLLWSEPHDNCSLYEACGKFAVCNSKKDTICECLPGFQPVSLEDWSVRQYSEGCIREGATCLQNSNNSKVKEDDFFSLRLKNAGVSDVVRFDSAQTGNECRQECLSTCKCKAYLYIDVNRTDGETGVAASECLIWTSDLENLQLADGDIVIELFARVPPVNIDSGQPNVPQKGQPSVLQQGQPNVPQQATESHNSPRERNIVVFIILFAGVLPPVLCFVCIVYWRSKMAKRHDDKQETSERNPVIFSYERKPNVIDFRDTSDTKGIDIPFYSFDTILFATDNFSEANKLGRGGFGPVYKGKFPGGQEIAVKRLSSCSGQGIEEFRNEVLLIAKLQHRNLVRLLGYCIKEGEKILLYEYMPNKSLDAFIFDRHNSLLLDWRKRFDIILGIARGLLYLHQDSRLRIIHRDLKTSNILLDDYMNPKISDFGLARIVQGNKTEASTNKVVGTFGYMSPEYALDGKFSTKSDVFSFGVVVLEIVSGKRNTGFYSPHEALNLLGYAWRLWNEDKALELVDDRLLETCEKPEVVKCINIGLLCVQEDPNDRPPMSSVVVMLGSESTLLPSPTQPAFVIRRRLSSIGSSSSIKPDTISGNEMTISDVEGR